MATVPTVPNFAAYNWVVGDTLAVVEKQNGLNAALLNFGNSLQEMTESINDDLNVISAAVSSVTNSQQAAQQAAASAQEDAGIAQQSAASAVSSAQQAGASSTSAASSANSASAAASAAEEDAIAVSADRSYVSSKASQVASDSAAAVTAQAAAEAARDQAQAISDPESAIEANFEIWVRDKERQALEAASGGLCTIERTPGGQACHMFVLPRLTWEELLPSQELGTGTHEAFIENGVEKSELLVGMYMAAEINGEMVSQPRTTGRRSITWDQSVSAAQASGFELFGNWEWSAVALWCMANGFQPRGNTDFGKSHSHPHERGVYDADSVSNEYTLLGSGPNAWSHNNAANGIADLVGNRWEWVRGFKMVDGRILLAPDNDAALAESAWVDTGWDMPSNRTWSTVDSAGAPQSVKRALIVPNGVSDPDGYLYTNLSGERFPIRGGARSGGANAGLAALFLDFARSSSHASFGLRLSRLV